MKSSFPNRAIRKTVLKQGLLASWVTKDKLRSFLSLDKVVHDTIFLVDR